MGLDDIINNIQNKIEYKKHREAIENQAKFYENPENAAKVVFAEGNVNGHNVIGCLQEITNLGIEGTIQEAERYGIGNEVRAIIDAYQNGEQSPVILNFSDDGMEEGEIIDVYCNPFVYEKDGQLVVSAIYSDGTYGIDGMDEFPKGSMLSDDMINFIDVAKSMQSSVEMDVLADEGMSFEK